MSHLQKALEISKFLTDDDETCPAAVRLICGEPGKGAADLSSIILAVLGQQAAERGGQVYTNHRGYIALGEHAGETFDGQFDGWSWHAWSGSHIAYGATEGPAVEHLKQKLGLVECAEDVQPPLVALS